LQLLRRTDGATVVEFGLVVAPFIAMLFAILQTTLVFFAGRILDHDRAHASQ
jgi:Flp pilus assembly protein TadG